MESIRQEEEKDYEIIDDVVRSAFLNGENGDVKEQKLVKRIRESKEYIPFLSLVYEINNKIVGHIMFSKIYIKNDEFEYTSLALASLSVLPVYQNMDIGTKLINEGFKLAKDLGFYSVIVIGDNKYYERFGFVSASEYNIKVGTVEMDKNLMVHELIEGGLKTIKGDIIFPKEFFE